MLPEPPKPWPQNRERLPRLLSPSRAWDGHASATIRSAGNLVTVRPGDRFGGGVITAVNRTGRVWVRRGNSSTALAFE
jgi:hypothetical protein